MRTILHHQITGIDYSNPANPKSVVVDVFSSNNDVFSKPIIQHLTKHKIEMIDSEIIKTKYDELGHE